jgi:hypothetical protein
METLLISFSLLAAELVEQDGSNHACEKQRCEITTMAVTAEDTVSK